MTSFMNYQQRKPTWYKGIVGENFINFITDTYKCIGEVSQRRSSVILDYSETRTNMPQALFKIYQMLWCNLSASQEECLFCISQLALKYTNRVQRVAKTNSPFLGKEEGKIWGGDEKYQDFFTAHRELVKQCYGYYEAIV